ncbi:MAG: alpha/beta fold hydrolase [Rubrimonas sp.]
MIPLILIPGHLCDHRLYAGLSPTLARRFDLRLAPPPKQDDIAAMAEAALGLAAGPAAFAGLSMGGMVAMAAIAQAPDRVLGAALFATDPTPARPREIAWRAGLRARVEEEGLATFVDAFLPNCLARDAGDRSAAFPTQARAMMLDAPAARFFAQARALDARRDMLGAVAAFPGPVEIVVGAGDRVCPPLLHRRLAEAAPAAALAELPGVGHLLTMEAPQAATAALERLAARIDPLSAPGRPVRR